MDIGKFPHSLLEKLLQKPRVADPRVLLGPGLGEDAAVIDLGETLLIAKSDPITFATDRIGWYAVQVNANDIACMGGTPRWFLATLLVPESFTEDQAEEVFNQVLDACNAIDVTLIGGHSEVTYGIDRPIVSGSMLGEVTRDRLVKTGGALEGDSIVVTKGLAIEGTALLALERADDLRKAGVSDDTITQCTDLLDAVGISVLADSQIACTIAQIHSMHDVTEGGLVTGLREIAAASGLGVAIEEGSIPILPETSKVCQALKIDPLGLLASGALLITLSPEDVPSLLSELEKKGIDGWEIGRMMPLEEGLVSIGRTGEVELPQFSRDELARYFSRPQA
ncbi:MAG: hydrogenase expression/formation protein [Dehalococcoidia bacterium]|nr:hydrogenase expression/formation protein [Dehalococcoidia bacterium]